MYDLLEEFYYPDHFIHYCDSTGREVNEDNYARYTEDLRFLASGAHML